MTKFSQLFKNSKIRVLLSALIFVLFFGAMGGGAGILANNLAKKYTSSSNTEITQNADMDNPIADNFANVSVNKEDDGKLHAAAETVTVYPLGYSNQKYTASVDTSAETIQLQSFTGTDYDLVINNTWVNSSNTSITYVNYTVNFYFKSTSTYTYYTKRASITSFTISDTSVNPIVFGKYSNGFYRLFNSCSKLTSVDFGYSDVSLVANVSYMFAGCSKLSTVNISNFNKGSASTTSYMFQYCI